MIPVLIVFLVLIVALAIVFAIWYFSSKSSAPTSAVCDEKKSMQYPAGKIHVGCKSAGKVAKKIKNGGNNFECVGQCIEDTDCVGVNIDKDNTCHMLTSLGERSADPNFATYRKTEAGACKKTTLFGGSASYVNCKNTNTDVIIDTFDASYMDCNKQCAEKDNCRGYNYDARSQTCQLLSAVNDLEDRPTTPNARHLVTDLTPIMN